MALAFIQQIGRKIPMVIEDTKSDWKLTVQDRCDVCAAQAFVGVRGITGELTFCAHHYSKIMDSPAGYEKMMGFMIEVVDQREDLVQDRLKD